MSEKPTTLLQQSWVMPRWIRTWLKYLAVTFPITLIAVTCNSDLYIWKLEGPGQVLVFVFMLTVVLGTFAFCAWRSLRWMFCLRNLKRTLFILACVVTVIGSFYAEEDFRGEHAWRQFQHECAAKGEHFEYASIVPPPVPEEQNFALTPVVATSYAMMLDKTGHEIQPRNTNVVNRLIMNYWGGHYSTNSAGNWVLGIKTDFTGLQQYYRTLALKTNLFQIPAQPGAPAVDVLLALSRFDPAIEELREAAKLPYSRFPLEYDKDDPAAILLPHLAALKSSAIVLQFRALAELQTGQVDQALADIRLILRLTEAIHSEPILISQLVRIAMVQIALQPVWEGLADRQWTELQLKVLDEEFAKLDFVVDEKNAMRGEMAFQNGIIQFLRRHPDQYENLFHDEGHDSDMTRTDFMMDFLMHWHLVPSGWFFQNQLACARLMEKHSLPVADLPTHTFIPSLANPWAALIEHESQHRNPYNVMEFRFLPALGNAATKFAHEQSSVDEARVAMALERFRMAQGHFPDSLAALTPALINPMPHDVIGGQPLHYRLTDDGQFVLYSVGWDEKDDGGVVKLNQEQKGQRLSEGDWVWQYPPK